MRSTAVPSAFETLAVVDEIMEFLVINGADKAQEPKVCSRLGRNGIIAAVTTEDVVEATDEVDELNDEFDGETTIEEEHEDGDVEIADTLGGMSIVWLSLPNLRRKRFFCGVNVGE